MRKSRIAIVFVVLNLGVVAFAGDALGADAVPFMGSDEGSFDFPGPCPDGSLEVVISGAGRATQLGAYTYTSTECFDPVSGTFAGSPRLTSANGDTMVGSYEGDVFGTSDPNVITYEEELKISGGTGRFAGAAGSLHVTGVANLATLEYTQTLTGTVSTPGSA